MHVCGYREERGEGGGEWGRKGREWDSEVRMGVYTHCVCDGDAFLTDRARVVDNLLRTSLWRH